MSFTLDLWPDLAAEAGGDGLGAAGDAAALADCAGELPLAFSDFSVSILACGAGAD